MRFELFYELLRQRIAGDHVSVDMLVELVNVHHAGIGTVTFRYTENFSGAQWGAFIRLEEERTSPYTECFSDVEIGINEIFREDAAMRRMVGAKELMHVFDDADRQAGSPEMFLRLVRDIANTPLPEDESEPFRADRTALWKAIVSLVPPELREAAVEAGEEVTALAKRWIVPIPVAGAAMGDYYPHMLSRFKLSK